MARSLALTVEKKTALLASGRASLSSGLVSLAHPNSCLTTASSVGHHWHTHVNGGTELLGTADSLVQQSFGGRPQSRHVSSRVSSILGPAK